MLALEKVSGQLHVPVSLSLKRCALYGSRLQAVTKRELCAYRQYIDPEPSNYTD
jgi:hypothetical protein